MALNDPHQKSETLPSARSVSTRPEPYARTRTGTLIPGPIEEDEGNGFRIHPDGPSVRETKREDTQPRGSRARRRMSSISAMELPSPRLAAVVSVLRAQFRRRPHASLALALGVGLVVGGGLSTRIGRIALAALGRHGLRELAKIAMSGADLPD